MWGNVLVHKNQGSDRIFKSAPVARVHVSDHGPFRRGKFNELVDYLQLGLGYMDMNSCRLRGFLVRPSEFGCNEVALPCPSGSCSLR